MVIGLHRKEQWRCSPVGVSPLTWGLGPFHARLPSSCSPSSTSLNSSSPSSFTPSRAFVAIFIWRFIALSLLHLVFQLHFPSPSRRTIVIASLQAGHTALRRSQNQPLFKAQTAAKVRSVLPLLKIKQAPPPERPLSSSLPASSSPTSVKENLESSRLFQAEMPNEGLSFEGAVRACLPCSHLSLCEVMVVGFCQV